MSRPDYLRNKAAYAARSKKWRLANPEKHAECTKKWRLANPEKVDGYRLKSK